MTSKEWATHNLDQIKKNGVNKQNSCSCSEKSVLLCIYWEQHQFQSTDNGLIVFISCHYHHIPTTITHVRDIYT